MAKKEKTPLPDEGSDNLITILSIAAAFVASVTLALVVGVALQYKITTAAIMPEDATSSQQATQPVRGQASQTDIEKYDISKPSGSESVPDGSEPTGGPADDPEDSEEPPQENVPSQAGTPSDTLTQTPNSNPGESSNKANPPKSSGTTPSNPNSGTNSGSAVTLPSTSGTNNSSPKEQSGGKIIYVTPTGKRYHYDNSCNGGTYIESSLEEAIRLELTPCGKCVS